MLQNFLNWGNDLHSGKRAIPFVPRRKLWLTISAVAVLISILVPIVRGGFNFSIEFRGGSTFTISQAQTDDPGPGERAVTAVRADADPRVIPHGAGSLQVQTVNLTEDETRQIVAGLTEAYGVQPNQISSSFVGPAWGQDVTEKMIRALVVYIVLAAIGMALYFRTWKMSLAAIIGIVQVTIVTTGIYSLTGFEISPVTIIGFLTVLSFALYDTVVVFDKIRENTQDYEDQTSRTFQELVNLGINQTTVRSINTTIVGTLPIAAILVIGVFILGAGTLTDIALSLFIGTLIATSSTLFVASPLYSLLRAREPKILAHADKVEKLRAAGRAESAETVASAG